MSKFLVLYRADASAAEQMANATPEQQAAGMQAWTDWFGRAGEAVVDGGSPLAGDDRTIGGYSILQADSREALETLLADHPHRSMGNIELFEVLATPGM
jgi:tagatose-1,6-bisphosphate aldolase